MSAASMGFLLLLRFFLLFMYVDLCVGGATVSPDGRGYNEKGSGRSGESLREGGGRRCTMHSGGRRRKRETARQRGGFGLPGTHSSSRQQSVSGGPLIQSAAASASKAPG